MVVLQGVAVAELPRTRAGSGARAAFCDGDDPPYCSRDHEQLALHRLRR